MADEPYETKEYEPFAIPGRFARKPEAVRKQAAAAQAVPTRFAEIEIPGAESTGRAVRAPRPDDERLQRFSEMRRIAWEYPGALSDHRKPLFQQVQRDQRAKVFYRQALFMKDFEDDFTGSVPFSAYYPYYQLMNHEQLRTYFTWRKGARSGNAAETSLSYVYVYVYELLNNIGVGSPKDGLETLVRFRRAYRAYDLTIDKYLLKWIKDYHIHYSLEKPFTDFICENNIHMYYPEVANECAGEIGEFDALCKVSSYDLRKSAFFYDEKGITLKDCFGFVMERLRVSFGQDYEGLFYRKPKKMPDYAPFGEALFYQPPDMPDRRIEISGSESYYFNRGKWYKTAKPDMDGRLLGYVMKLTEKFLRLLAGYGRQFAVNANMAGEAARRLDALGVSLENVIETAVKDFYAEANKIKVTIDTGALDKIRREAMDTQERLIVQEAPEDAPPAEVAAEAQVLAKPDGPCAQADEPAGIWGAFMDSLTEREVESLRVILLNGDLSGYAGKLGIMAEVLVDGINQKASDYISDTVIDSGGSVYEEYRDELYKRFQERNGFAN